MALLVIKLEIKSVYILNCKSLSFAFNLNLHVYKQIFQMMKNKILITGCAGFVGSNLAEKLIKNKNNHVMVYNLSTGQIRFLSKIKKRILNL